MGVVFQPHIPTTISGNFYKGRYSVRLIRTDGTTSASADAQLQELGNGVRPIPPLSVTSNRVYYLDAGGALKWVAADGTRGEAGKLPTQSGRQVSFAVSPDNRMIAVGLVDYNSQGHHMEIYDQEIGGANRHELFTADSVVEQDPNSPPYQSKPLEWPVGWHSGLVVLAVGAANNQNPAEFQLEVQDFHLDDSTTGTRLASVCDEPGNQGTRAPLNSGGVLCSRSLGAGYTTEVWGWDGTSVHLPQLDGCSFGVSGPVSPDGSRFALRGISSSHGAQGCVQDTPGMVLIDRAGHTSQLVPKGDPAGWIDATHLVFAPGDAAYIDHKLQVLDVLSSKVNIVGDRGYFFGALPGGLG